MELQAPFSTYSQKNIPVSYDVKKFEGMYQEEPFDSALPANGGFLSDFVLATRLIQVPTSFTAWTALFLVSSALRRMAWFKWFPTSLIPNLYVLLVAPPGLCKKNTILGYGRRILSMYNKTIIDPLGSAIHRVNVFRGEATPQYLHECLLPEVESVIVNDQVKLIDRGSQLSIIVPEFVTFLGKQKYNIGLVEKLTALYDCEDADDKGSKKEGTQTLKNIFVSLIGGATPSGLKDSMPEEAFGGGLMSRMTIVYEPRPTRFYPEPRPLEGAPDEIELAKRLAYIAQKGSGEYYFSQIAKEAFDSWYYDFMQKLVKSGNVTEAQARKDVLIRKVALLLRASRYEPGFQIELSDLLNAETLIQATEKNSGAATDAVGADKYGRAFDKVKEYIREGKKVMRRNLLRALSHTCNVEMLDRILAQLVQSEQIKVYREGDYHAYTSKQSTEEYHWCAS